MHWRGPAAHCLVEFLAAPLSWREQKPLVLSPPGRRGCCAERGCSPPGATRGHQCVDTRAAFKWDAATWNSDVLASRSRIVNELFSRLRLFAPPRFRRPQRDEEFDARIDDVLGYRSPTATSCSIGVNNRKFVAADQHDLCFPAPRDRFVKIHCCVEASEAATGNHNPDLHIDSHRAKRLQPAPK